MSDDRSLALAYAEKMASLSEGFKAFLMANIFGCRTPEGCDGWSYGDLPPLPLPVFEAWCSAVGDENLHWLAAARIGDKVRGQYFISPAGLERIAAWTKGAAS